MKLKPWGIWRSQTTVDPDGLRHTVATWTLGYAGPLHFDTEAEASAAAGVYNQVDTMWRYSARRFDAE